MHGRKRSEYKARFNDPKKVLELEQKAKQWTVLSKEVVKRMQTIRKEAEGRQQQQQHHHHQQQQTQTQNQEKEEASLSSNNNTNNDDCNKILRKETLDLTYKLLSVNPDPMYIWNYRRELLLLFNNGDSTTTTTTTTTLDKDEKKENDYYFNIDNELTLTSTCLSQRNPKAYPAWFHRKWSIKEYITKKKYNNEKNSSSSVGDIEELLQNELQLTKLFLDKDERNFHCWNYRRYIIGISIELLSIQKEDEQGQPNLLLLDGSWKYNDNNSNNSNSNKMIMMGGQLVPPDNIEPGLLAPTACSAEVEEERQKKIQDIINKEWDYTTEKIEQNFSNCSAFHYRSKLLQINLSLVTNKNNNSTNNSEEIIQIIRDELEITLNAIFTEPDDQTAWLYHTFIINFLFSTTVFPVTKDNDEEKITETTVLISTIDDILCNEIESIQELINDDSSNKCKWGWLTIYSLYEKRIQLLKEKRTIETKDDEEGEEDEDGKILSTIQNLQDKMKNCLHTLNELDPDRSQRYNYMLNNNM